MHETPRSPDPRPAAFAAGAAAAATAIAVVTVVGHPGDGTWLGGAVAQGAVTGGVLVLLARHLRFVEHQVDGEVGQRRAEGDRAVARTAALQAVADACPTMKELDRLGPNRLHQVVGGSAVPRQNGRPDWDAYYEQVAPYVSDRLTMIAERLTEAAGMHQGTVADDLRTIASLTEDQAMSWRGWQGTERRPRLLHLRQHIALIRHQFDLRHDAPGHTGIDGLAALVVEIQTLDDHEALAKQVPDSADA